MMTSSSSSLCRRHSDVHSPLSYTPSPLSAFLQSSTDYRGSSTATRSTQHSYQTTGDYLAQPTRVTSASGLHGDAITLQQQQQQQRSPSFAIHELLGLHGPMLAGTAGVGNTCHGGMFDCSAGGGGYSAAMTGGASSYRGQFFPTYHSSAAAALPPSTQLDLEPPPPTPLLPGPPSCHRAASTSSSWPPSTSPTSHVPQLTTAVTAHHVHRPTSYRDAYDVLQLHRNFKEHSSVDVTRTFAPAAAAAARSVVGHHKYSTHYRTYSSYSSMFFLLLVVIV